MKSGQKHLSEGPKKFCKFKAQFDASTDDEKQEVHLHWSKAKQLSEMH